MGNKSLQYSTKYRKIFRVLTIAAEICGANVFREDYCMNWVSYAVLVLINSFYLMTLYTIFVEIQKGASWTVALESFCLASSAIQVNLSNS